jgi:hypothetical protein
MYPCLLSLSFPDKLHAYSDSLKLKSEYISSRDPKISPLTREFLFHGCYDGSNRLIKRGGTYKYLFL